MSIQVYAQYTYELAVMHSHYTYMYIHTLAGRYCRMKVIIIFILFDQHFRRKSALITY